MIKRVEHLGIAVHDLEQAIPLYENLLGIFCYKQEIVESEGVLTAFLKVGESKIELLQATRPDSAIARYLEKHKGGFHHVAFETTDIDAELQRLNELGFELIHQSPKEGADNKRIAFLHPKSTLGLLVELCQEKSASSD